MARRRVQVGSILKKGPSWYVRYYVDDGYDPSTGKILRRREIKYVAAAEGPEAVKLRVAQRIAYDEHISKLAAATGSPTLGGSATLESFVKSRFIPDVVENMRTNGKIFYNSMLNGHILPALGKLKLRDITPQAVQRLLTAKVEGGYSVQTARHIKNCLSATLRHAKAMQCLSGDLATEGARLPENNATPRRALTWAQVEAISNEIGRPEPAETPKGMAMQKAWAEEIEGRNALLGGLVRILARTGLRIGEAMGLRWRDINLTDQQVIQDDGSIIPPYTVSVRNNYVRGEYGPLKTRSSRRDIPLVEDNLKDFELLTPAPTQDSPVFAAGNGRPLDEHNIAARWLKPAVKRLELPWASWHSLRHTFSTLGQASGMNLEQRRLVMGHAATTQTSQYTHPDYEHLRAEMNKLSLKVKKAGS